MTRSVLALGTVLSFVTCVFATSGRPGLIGPETNADHRLVRVIVETADAANVERLVAELGGRPGRRLAGMHAVAAEVPKGRLARLTTASMVRSVRVDRPLRGTLELTAATIGARWVAENLGLDGTGIGVAIIDSGVTRWHDDLGPNKIAHFADFVDFQPQPHDGYGHGTHVAGIIAGNGYDSGGTRRGIASGAHLVVLKVLDEHGDGYISNAIAAIDYAIEQRAAYNIRVINLSVAAGVFESYNTDPLTLAARRAVDAGIVVVTAAGNLGRNSKGLPQISGITAPGNAPWVLTVGASSHNGTFDPADDTIAPFSSVGPSLIDSTAKPDLVAPGVGIESLADSGSTLFTTRATARIWGTVATSSEPYLLLSGTSMAAPVVAATVVLMVQANPALTPGAVKALLQASADARGYSRLAQGAGFLNARAAVGLAQTFSENAEAIGRLDDAAAEAAVEDAAPCTDAGMNCADFAQLCSADADCFGNLDALIGVTAAESGTIAWEMQPAAIERRRPRLARQRRERITKGNSRSSQ